MDEKNVPIKRKFSLKALPIAGLFIVAIAALLFMSFVAVAYYNGGMNSSVDTLKGEIVAIDKVHNAQTLTLLSNQIGQFPNDRLNIFLNGNTKVRICNEKKPLNDMSVGRTATVVYKELGGVAVADRIYERC